MPPQVAVYAKDAARQGGIPITGKEAVVPTMSGTGTIYTPATLTIPLKCGLKPPVEADGWHLSCLGMCHWATV